MVKSQNGYIRPETEGELVLFAVGMLGDFGHIAPKMLSKHSGLSLRRCRKAVHQLRDFGLCERKGNLYTQVKDNWLNHYYGGNNGV